MEKTRQVTFRIESSLWSAFVEACASEDTTASRELRRFIRDYMKDRRQTSFLERSR